MVALRWLSGKAVWKMYSASWKAGMKLSASSQVGRRSTPAQGTPGAARAACPPRPAATAHRPSYPEALVDQQSDQRAREEAGGAGHHAHRAAMHGQPELLDARRGSEMDARRRQRGRHGDKEADGGWKEAEPCVTKERSVPGCCVLASRASSVDAGGERPKYLRPSEHPILCHCGTVAD